MKIKYLLIISFLLCYTTISAYDFEVEGLCFNIISNDDLTVKVTYKFDYIGYNYNTINIPKTVQYDGKTYNVTTIGYSAFCRSNAQNINIPSSITTIESYAFWMSNIDTITIPNNVTSIGNSAFDSSKITTLVIEDGSDELFFSTGNSAMDFNIFTGTQLRNVYLGRNINYNVISPFHHLPIEKLKIGTQVTMIRRNCFNSCENIKEINIPNSVTYIGECAFEGCSGIKSIIIPASVTTIENGIFSNAFRSKKNLSFVKFEDGKLPIKCTWYNKAPFENCSIDSVYWGRIITAESKAIFLRADVEKLFIGEYVTDIISNQFSSLGLKKLYITKNISYISYQAFAHNQIEDVYCLSNKALSTNIDAFYDTPISTSFLHVPREAINRFKTHSVWGTFGEVIPIKETIICNESDENDYWTTFYDTKYNYTIDESANVYSVKYEYSNNTLILSEIKNNIIKAGQGVVIRAKSKVIDAYLTLSRATNSYYEDNILTGGIITDSISEKYNIYTFFNSNNIIGFRKTDTDFNINPNEAYIIDNRIGIPDIISINKYDESETNLFFSRGKDHNYVIKYDIQGRIANNTKQKIKILNGKKILTM